MASQYKYSAQATRVIYWATEEAKRLQHSEIDPEHLLLGMIHEQKGLARFILHSLGVDFEELEKEIRETFSDTDLEEGQTPSMSTTSKRIIELGIQSAEVLDRPYLGTEHLLIGILREISSRSYSILRRGGVTYSKVLEKVRTMPMEGIVRGLRGQQDQDVARAGIKPGDELTPGKVLLMVSPVFWFLLSGAIIFGMAAYYGWMPANIAVFLFVTGGWVVSVSLHEFGHALAAYLGGDHSVLNKGYLTLNPLRYTHGFLSIGLPLLYLAMGGIGLPGGAVYIDMGAIKNKYVRSLVSAAGPIMTGGFALLLAMPFIFGVDPVEFETHLPFWSGLGFLTFLQITALLFNLLPIPGLDGLGIVMPFMSPKMAQMFASFRSLTFILIIMFFLNDTPIRRGFWSLIALLMAFFNVDFELVGYGFSFYRFWAN